MLICIYMNNDIKEKKGTLRMKDALKSWSFWKPVKGIIAGAVLGFLYYRFVGCNSGSCPLTGNPYMTVLFGAGIGYLATSGQCVRC